MRKGRMECFVVFFRVWFKGIGWSCWHEHQVTAEPEVWLCSQELSGMCWHWVVTHILCAALASAVEQALEWKPAGDKLALPLGTWSPGIYPVMPQKIPAGGAGRWHHVNMQAASKQSLCPMLKLGSAYLTPPPFRSALSGRHLAAFLVGTMTEALPRGQRGGFLVSLAALPAVGEAVGQLGSPSRRLCSVPSRRGQRR